MSKDKITHAQFDLPQPTVHPKHPLKDAKNHKKLLEYLTSRLMLDAPNRDQRVKRYSQVDRDVAGWMRLSDEDRKRKNKHDVDGTPQATQVSLPLSWVHLDDMMTYYAQTFSPNRGMFYHTATPESATDATQLVSLMNNHAVYGSYYRHLLRSIFNILKYNVGGIITNWATDFGPKLEMDVDGKDSVTEVPIFKGNKIEAIDQYNVFYDPTVDPTCLYNEGEWFAVARAKSHFWLKKRALAGLYFNCDTALASEQNVSELRWYKDAPTEARLAEDETKAGETNWVSFMTGMDSPLMNNVFELVTFYIRLNPNDFNLIEGTREAKAQRNRYEIWKITLLNGAQIIEAQYMNNIHGYLPCFFGTINDDMMKESSKSAAEILNPLQQFSSFLLNAHVLANRKNIYGTTFFDPSRVDYDKIPAGEVAARVPIKAQGYGQDIRTMVYHDNHQLDTKQTLEDLQGMLGIINQFFPTQSLPGQIAGIDRAIDSQVAAVQQGSNRRQHKNARLIDDTMMRPFRFSLYYNIVQFQEDGEEIIDYASGESDKVDLSKLRETNLAFLIGQGLKAIDRQNVASQMRELIFAMIQAPQIVQAARIDLLGMLDFWTSMMDIDANMKQFQLPAPTPEEVAAQQGGAAGGEMQGTGITPATAPEAVAGGPIYGA